MRLIDAGSPDSKIRNRGFAAWHEAMPRQISEESADKPGSVVDSHSSRTHVTARLERPTREPCGPHVRSCLQCPPIWSCSRRGLPCHFRYRKRGALLPHHFTLTAVPRESRRYIFCGTFRRLAPPRRYLAPRPAEPGLSSPHINDLGSDCLADSRGYCIKTSVEWLVTCLLHGYFELIAKRNLGKACVC
jgi:hypothetical protein